MRGQCDKALDSAGEVCPACFRVHEPRPQPEPEPAAPELTYADYISRELLRSEEES